MLKTLIAVRFRALLSAMFRTSKKGKPKNPVVKALFALLAVYVVGCFVSLFGMMFASLYPALTALRMRTLYFAIAGFVALLLSFVGTVFATQSQLYDAKDNEMLLAMPIPPFMILLSRMIVLYLTNLLMSLLVLLPAGVIYWMNEPVRSGGMLSFAAGCLLVPLGALTLSCVLGWVFAWLGSRMRNKNIISLIASLAFFAAYFGVITQGEKLMAVLLAHYAEAAGFLQRAAYPVWQMGLAITRGDWMALIRFVLCMVVPFAVVLVVLARSFIGIATRRRGGVRVKYRRQAMKVSSVQGALLLKELRHFGSSVGWMLNGGIGLLFMLVIPVMLMVNRDMMDMLVAQWPFLGDNLSVMMGALQCLMLAMCTISAGSISLEGKNLWLAQSIPVDAKDILLSKARLQAVVSLPFVLAAAIMTWIALPGNVLGNTLALLLPAVYAVMMSLLGVALNVRFPKFDWTSETAAVKQGASVIADMGAGLALLATPVLVYALWLNRLMSVTVFGLIMIPVYAGVCALLYRYLGHGGRKRFMNL